MPLFDCPRERREGLETVKKALGIHHNYLDGWVYLFFENKKFDVAETIAKLERRDAMEKTVFSQYVMTPSLRESMRAGIVQYVGRDKVGRPVLYFNTVRDTPKAEQRAERQANMDMFLSWAVRCDPANPTSAVTWLINQKDASMLRNTDLIFQKDMALRISKFSPGVVARMYICNMGSALTFVMKPLLKQLPKALSDCIFMFSAGDIRRGKLLEYIDADVLPIDMGGQNDCDNQQNYNFFATAVEEYFSNCITSLQQGVSIKQMEMMQVYPVDKNGKPLATPGERSSVTPKREASTGATANGQESSRKMVEDTLEGALVAEKSAIHGSRISVNRRKETIVVCSAQLYDSGALTPQASLAHPIEQEEGACTSPSNVPLVFFSDKPADGVDNRSIDYRTAMVPTPPIDRIEECAVSRSVARKLKIPNARVDEMLRDWVRFRCLGVELVPQLRLLLQALRDDTISSNVLTQLDEEGGAAFHRLCHHVLNLAPQTSEILRFPLVKWFTAGIYAKFGVETDLRESVEIDCTSPDNTLLCIQGLLVEYVDECETLIEMDKFKERALRRIQLSWKALTATPTQYMAAIEERMEALWAQLVPLFRGYIEAKVGACIVQFVEQYGLLVPGGVINPEADWYKSLFNGVMRFRELQRNNWLFHTFPPLFRDAGTFEDAPTIEELLEADGRPLTFNAVSTLVLTALSRLLYTREDIAAAPHLKVKTLLIERYMEERKAAIYIPYESQQDGFSAQKLKDANQQKAVRALTEAEAPMREYLFQATMMFLLKYKMQNSTDQSACLAVVERMRNRSIGYIQARRQCRLFAVSYAKVAYDLQGSFGTDHFNMLEVTQEKPGLQELGIELLFVDAYLNLRRQMPATANDSFMTDDMANAMQEALKQPHEHSVTTIAPLLDLIKKMDGTAALLSSVKRKFVF
ncbi:hypothetical protein STCU_07041 [Strigomonas culicis]|uniref:CRAL-TRIO domain-containing protein n=1 Tax=Strigomonas culicis TaxID=28005 RepID=S9TZC3_9TRYP|nr:hypothetical protein STCU_07400 [Strigomonas culicis]EPY24715.1 hypothetical protein STCU_07041 [Strigomonas culicis]|eukprot:EPY23897.1 hypothetical protein STCU_07400 [Strigomonas culicis]